MKWGSESVETRWSVQATGTPAKRWWGTACPHVLEAPQDISALVGFSGIGVPLQEPSQREGITGHPLTPPSPRWAGPPGSAPARPGRPSHQGLLFGGTCMKGAVGNPALRAVSSLQSPGCWGQNGARRPFGFSLLGNVTLLWSDGLLWSSGRCSFDLRPG